MNGMEFTYADAQGLLKQLKSEHRCRKRIALEISPSLKRSLGLTMQTGKDLVIKLSAYLSYDEMQDTLRHEFAHVMAGLKKGHGQDWKNWAVEVGAEPRRCAPRYPALTPLHTYTCPQCKDTVIRRANRLRMGKGWACRHCATPVSKFTYAYVDPLNDPAPSAPEPVPEGQLSLPI